MDAPVRILYVDDDAGLGILLSRALSRHGYQVDACARRFVPLWNRISCAARPKTPAARSRKRGRAEMLLREVNHRVANSLAMVSSFVHMQAHLLNDPAARELLRDTQARIAAIAGVRRRLYTSDDVRSVEINAYLRSLVEDLSATMKLDVTNLRFVPAPVEIQVPTDKTVALGVIVTELVTNAYKYA